MNSTTTTSDSLIEQIHERRAADKYIEALARVRDMWAERVTMLALKPKSKAYRIELAAFTSGVLSAMQATGNMSDSQVDMVRFLFAVGRGDQWMSGDIGR